MPTQIAKYKTWGLAVFFFFLPWQTRLIFFETIVGGIASPFGIVSLYATEVLLLLGGLLTLLFARPRIDRAYHWSVWLITGVFLASALSLLVTPNVALSLNALCHLGAASGLFILLLDKDIQLKPILFAFGAGLIAPVVLAFWQVIFDASSASTVLGLAERNAEVLGDSITVKNGVRELRAYGSFPHPNIFGGYLAVAVLAVRELLSKKGSERERRLLLGIMLFLVTGLVFTWSRSALLGLFLGMGLAAFVSYAKNKAKARLAIIPLAVGVIAGVWLMSIFAPSAIESIRGGGVTEEQALSERVSQYYKYPLVIGDSWLLGSGIGAYVIDAFESGACYSWDCQPVHNVPLLIIAEVGVIGLLLLAFWLYSIGRINFTRFPNPDALVAFAMGNVLLVIIFFDHYLWSSWPGLALTAFVMALTVKMGEKA